MLSRLVLCGPKTLLINNVSLRRGGAYRAQALVPVRRALHLTPRACQGLSNRTESNDSPENSSDEAHNASTSPESKSNPSAEESDQQASSDTLLSRESATASNPSEPRIEIGQPKLGATTLPDGSATLEEVMKRGRKRVTSSETQTARIRKASAASRKPVRAEDASVDAGKPERKLKSRKSPSTTQSNTPQAIQLDIQDMLQKFPSKSKTGAPFGVTLTEKLTQRSRKKARFPRESVDSISGSQLPFEALDAGEPTVPHLCHGLDRVLFNPGVYHLQDPRSRVYNFDPYLEKIMPVQEFDWGALNPYVTSSEDTRLAEVAAIHGKKYTCSTSSTTAVLSHFHFLLSQWREIEWGMLTKAFPTVSNKFTGITRAPAAIVLRWQNGTYAIDADKEYNEPTVLSKIGHSLEKLLTVPAWHFKKYGKSNPERLSEEERGQPESYHYSTISNFVMRSQLDAHDSRLPGTGMFDLKTRAVISIRMNAREDPGEHMGYQLRYRQGEWESFEREYHDMVRSTMLKYSLQVRMGRMDGIFVAYHNVERIFGFQYISLPEMDEALHGQSDCALGDQEFKLSMGLFNEILERATTKFPSQSIRFHFEAREAVTPFMYIYAEPVTDEEIQALGERAAAKTKAYEESLLQNSPVSKIPLDEETSQEWEKIEEEVANETEGDNDQPGTSNANELEQINDPDSSIGTGQDNSQVDEAINLITNSATADQTGEQGPVSPATEKYEQTDTLENPQRQKPLLAMVLIIRNKLNGQYVQRPTNFNSEDEWEVEYALNELEDGWKSYEACRSRRKKALDTDATSTYNGFRNALMKISRTGREWREGQDKIDESMGTVIFAPMDTTPPESKDT